MIYSTPSSATAYNRLKHNELEQRSAAPVKRYLLPAVVACVLADPNISYSMDSLAYSKANTITFHCYSDDTNNSHTIDISGETFSWSAEDGLVIISHPKWSTIGIGHDLNEAKIDFRTNAEIIKDDFINKDDSLLTKDAVLLKRFLIKYFI